MKLALNIPLERIAKLFMRFGPRKGPVTSLTLRKGSRYEVGGELFEVSEVYPYAIVLRPVNTNLKLVKVG
ncbi:MAG: hypothetical protein UMS36scaffold28_20 [Phage 59_13]|nr:MAG: hypothetical protein UMS36scaffold28_20 [Phage 59_13]